MYAGHVSTGWVLMYNYTRLFRPRISMGFPFVVVERFTVALDRRDLHFKGWSGLTGILRYIQL